MISELKQVAIPNPKVIRGRFGVEPNMDVDGHAPFSNEKLLNGEADAALHPVDRVYGILGSPGSTDEYLAEIRGC